MFSFNTALEVVLAAITVIGREKNPHIVCFVGDAAEGKTKVYPTRRTALELASLGNGSSIRATVRLESSWTKCTYEKKDGSEGEAWRNSVYVKLVSINEVLEQGVMPAPKDEAKTMDRIPG